MYCILKIFEYLDCATSDSLLSIVKAIPIANPIPNPIPNAIPNAIAFTIIYIDVLTIRLDSFYIYAIFFLNLLILGERSTEIS